MTDCLRPLPDPDAPDHAPRIAGGWVRFRAVEHLRRGLPPTRVAADALDAETLRTLSAPRPDVAGLSMDRPRIMGILNITPDSFSDGGRNLAPEAAVAEADRQAAADILDVGGESTRPGASEVPAEEEAARIAPVIAALRHRRLSVDTRKAFVARAALTTGAAMVNDVSGLRFDPGMAATLAASDVAVCLMHSVGTPETMQSLAAYEDVVLDVFDSLAATIARAEAAGIARSRIVADPGIGFGKSEAHNLALIRRIGAFHALGVPLLLGASRKRFIGRIADVQQPADRMPGTLAVTLAAVAQGVQIHRVHDVAAVAQGLALWRAVTEE